MKWFKKAEKKSSERSVGSPVKGTVISITEVNDQVFSQEIMGKGLGIKADENVLTSPVSGKIVTFFPTKHAIGIQTDDGLELLIHVGVDTVKLDGLHFTALKGQGDTVKRGDPLLEVDFEALEKEGYETTVILVVTNTDQFPNLKMNYGPVEKNQEIMTY